MRIAFFGKQCCNRLIRSQAGLAAIEFALALPLLLVFLVGSIEIARYAIIQQKLDKVSYTMGDLATQTANPTTDQLDDYALAANQIMSPFGFDGAIIFTTVKSYNASDTSPACGTKPEERINCITSQHVALNKTANSALGPSKHTTDKLPTGYQVAAGENIIFTEVQYNYEPLLPISKSLTNLLQPGTATSSTAPEVIAKTSLLKPREVTTIVNTTSVITCDASYQKLDPTTNTCITKTCAADNFNCPPACASDPAQKLVDSSVNTTNPNFSPDYSNAYCTPKTCKDDGYLCAVCIGDQILDRAANRCIDPVCGTNQRLDQTTKTCVDGGCPDSTCTTVTCLSSEKKVNGVCVPLTCYDDGYGCSQCQGEEILNRTLNKCEPGNCNPDQKWDASLKKCVPMTCLADGYNCCKPIGQQSVDPVTKECIDPICLPGYVLNPVTKICMPDPNGICLTNTITAPNGKVLYLIGAAINKKPTISSNASVFHFTPGNTAGPNGGKAGNGPSGATMMNQTQINAFVSISNIDVANYNNSDTRGWNFYSGKNLFNVNSVGKTNLLRFYMSKTLPDIIWNGARCECRYKSVKIPNTLNKTLYLVDAAVDKKDVMLANLGAIHFIPGHTAGPNGGKAGNGPSDISMMNQQGINSHITITKIEELSYASNETRGWQNKGNNHWFVVNSVDKTKLLKFWLSTTAPSCSEAVPPLGSLICTSPLCGLTLNSSGQL